MVVEQQRSPEKLVGVGKPPASSQVSKSQDMVAAAEDFKNDGHITRDDFSDKEESQL